MLGELVSKVKGFASMVFCFVTSTVSDRNTVFGNCPIAIITPSV